ncbi:uncharacterized protein TNCT_296821 [Trichonephila clavata]|uniref:Gustatory receptor n=1 Tax=Trichonephila clavata TaxID=2740835 RepID=A0A8X6KZJ2_TRICU|nr:uncharacterized protein TNCT_296821 [Trichonephila clavata]
MYLYFVIPFNTFAIYYTVVCYHLRRMTKVFAKSIKSSTYLNLGKATQTYKALKSLVAKIDRELSFLMFTTTLFNACTMYLGIKSLLRSGEFPIIAQHISVWCLFIASYLSFIAMGTMASLVFEANANGLEKLKDAICNRFNITRSQMRVLLTDANDVSLTVWNIVPIRRSFIFGTIGAILTYCVLIESLEKVP